MCLALEQLAKQNKMQNLLGIKHKNVSLLLMFFCFVFLHFWHKDILQTLQTCQKCLFLKFQAAVVSKLKLKVIGLVLTVTKIHQFLLPPKNT